MVRAPMVKVPGRYYVEALGRGMSILDCFVGGAPHLSLGEISAKVGLQKGTTFRLLRTLEEAGYVRQDPDTKKYCLSFKVLDLQQAALGAFNLSQYALPILEEVNQALNESVSVSVLEGAKIRYIARVPSRRIMAINLQIGSTLPAHATSMGKVLLTRLSDEEIIDLYNDSGLELFTSKTIRSIDQLLETLNRIRKEGFAIADEELEPGLRSAAVPIRDRQGSVVAAMNASAASARVSVRQIRDEFVPRLLTAAALISHRLGYHPPHAVEE